MNKPRRAAGQILAGIESAIHYPDCWDTAAYPTLESALHELTAWFRATGCSTCQEKPVQKSPGDKNE